MNKLEPTHLLTPDIRAADEHLKLLAGDEKNFLFTAFDDNQDRKAPPRTFYGTLDKCVDELTRLNNQGYGIFVTVNETAGDRRNADAIVGYRAVWIENDTGIKSNTPIVPDFVIESSPGKYHEYFLVNGLDYFQRIALQEELVNNYHCDKNAADEARVLRLAGFIHQKVNADKGLDGQPHMVQVIQRSQRETLNAIALMKSFGLPTTLKGLVNTSDKVADRYTQLVAGLNSVRCCLTKPSENQPAPQHFKAVERALSVSRIGNDRHHPELSEKHINRVLEALEGIKKGSFDGCKAGLDNLDKIIFNFEKTCPNQKLITTPITPANDDRFDIRYLWSEQTIKEIKTALRLIDADDREIWIKVGLALKGHSGPNGFEMWNDWSKKSDKYDPADMRRTWDSFEPRHVGIGTIFHLANESINQFAATAKQKGELTEANCKQWIQELREKFDLEECPQVLDTLNTITSEKQATSLAFRLTPAYELTQTPSPPDWLIERVCERGTLVQLFGKPASGKSFIALDMAFCIANGLEWHGKRVHQGEVVYIAGEGRRGLGRRLRALEVKHGNDATHNLFVSDTVGQLIDEQNVSEIAQAIELTCPDVELIIIDTLHRNMGGGDENSAADMSVILHHLNLLQQINNATVMIVHHTGHGDTVRARGSSSIRAAMDTEFCVDKKAGLITMSCTKSKDNDEPETMCFESKEVNTGFLDENGFPVFSIVLESVERKVEAAPKLSGREQLAFDALKTTIQKNGIEPPDSLLTQLVLCGYEEWRFPITVVKREDWKRTLLPLLDVVVDAKDPDEAKRKTFDRVRAGLQKKNVVAMCDDYWWIIG